MKSVETVILFTGGSDWLENEVLKLVQEINQQLILAASSHEKCTRKKIFIKKKSFIFNFYFFLPVSLRYTIFHLLLSFPCLLSGGLKVCWIFTRPDFQDLELNTKKNPNKKQTLSLVRVKTAFECPTRHTSFFSIKLEWEYDSRMSARHKPAIHSH